MHSKEGRVKRTYEAGTQNISFRKMCSNTLSSRWLIQQLFLRDIMSAYKQSFLGIFWGMLNPTLTLATFILLNSSGILLTGEMKAPYPIFAILGLTLWQVFSAGLMSTTSAIIYSGEMIRKINFPRDTLIFASMAQPMIALTTNLALMVPIFIFYGFTPTPYILLLPLLALPVLILTLGLGLILSLINAVTHDLSRMLNFLMTLLLFLTPIMYSNPRSGAIGLMASINPVYYLIDQPRTLILTGHLTEPTAYLASVLLAVITFLLCWKAFHKTSPKIAERI